jgi:hypothetical protein
LYLSETSGAGESRIEARNPDANMKESGAFTPY